MTSSNLQHVALISGLKFGSWCFPGAWILVLGIFLGFGF
jgi:hypothetical protein